MQGPKQLPDEGDTILTYVGTGLAQPTKVKAEVESVQDSQIAYTVLETIEEGDADADNGRTYGSETDGFLWETA